MTSTARAKVLLAEQTRRNRLPKALAELVAGFHPKQRLMFDSKHKRKVGKAGRRGGKTHELLGEALNAAVLFPGAQIPICERTLECNAAKRLWKDLIALDGKYELGINFHHTYKTATLSNKSEIKLWGTDTQEGCDKVRGEGVPWVGVDEAGHYRSKVLEYLLTEVVEPMLVDHNGTVSVYGTPGLDLTGQWYRMCHDSTGIWEQHYWTLLDNPYLGVGTDAERAEYRERVLVEVRQAYGWSETTPRYLREWLGIWAAGDGDKCYPLTWDRNVIPALPETPTWNPWRYWLGLDLGFHDPCAFVIYAGRRDDPCIYVAKSYERQGLIPSAVAAEVERLRDEYDGFVTIVADTGGYGKGVAVEMQQKFGIPVEGAKKRDKRVYMEHTAGDCSNGRIKIVQRTNRELLDDLFHLAWNDDRTDNDPNQRDHLPDAFLYGHRHRPFTQLGLGDADAPERGSNAWQTAQEEALIERLEDELTEQLEADKTFELLGNPNGED